MLNENVLLWDFESYVNARFLCFCIPIATLMMTSGKMPIFSPVTASQNANLLPPRRAGTRSKSQTYTIILIMHEWAAHCNTSLKWHICCWFCAIDVCPLGINELIWNYVLFSEEFKWGMFKTKLQAVDQYISYLESESIYLCSMMCYSFKVMVFY